MTGTQHFTPLTEELKLLGFDAADVKKIIIGHAHWDHAGQLLDFPNATLYVQREELRGIEWALNYPNPHISAVNNTPGGCFRSPACGYEPLTMEQVYGKVLHGKAVIVDGEMEIMPGVVIHPAFRAHTNGSQLAGSADQYRQAGVRFRRVFVVGGDPRLDARKHPADRHGAAIPRIRAMLQDHRRLQNCVAAHEPLSYTDKYPLTKNSWVGPNGSRMAEIALAPGERSRHP